MGEHSDSVEDCVLAFDVGGTTTKAEVLTADRVALAALTVPTRRGAALVDLLADTGANLLDTLPPQARSHVRAVGLALPGIIDTAAGVGVYAANLGLRDTPVAEPLRARLGLPVFLGHDVAAAAEAERRYGAALEAPDPVVVVIGTGIAAVSYVHGEPVTGVSGQAGELGHVVVRPGGPRCGCGARGCLEAVASAAAIVRAYHDVTGMALDGAEALVARLGHDRVADAVWGEATAALADGLMAAVALLAPGVIVLGGGLSEAGDTLLDPVAAHLRARQPALRIPPLRRAALGRRAGVVGAGLLALDRVQAPDLSPTPDDSRRQP